MGLFQQPTRRNLDAKQPGKEEVPVLVPDADVGEVKECRRIQGKSRGQPVLETYA